MSEIAAIFCIVYAGTNVYKNSSIGYLILGKFFVLQAKIVA
jgi:hypothetical protein